VWWSISCGGGNRWWLEFADLVLRYEQRLSKKQRQRFRTGESVGDSAADGPCDYFLVSVSCKSGSAMGNQDDEDDPDDIIKQNIVQMSQDIRTLSNKVDTLTSLLSSHVLAARSETAKQPGASKPACLHHASSVQASRTSMSQIIQEHPPRHITQSAHHLPIQSSHSTRDNAHEHQDAPATTPHAAAQKQAPDVFAHTHTHHIKGTEWSASPERAMQASSPSLYPPTVLFEPLSPLTNGAQVIHALTCSTILPLACPRHTCSSIQWSVLWLLCLLFPTLSQRQRNGASIWP